MELLLVIAICVAIWFFISQYRANKRNEALTETIKQRDDQIAARQAEKEMLQARIDSLAKFQGILDAEAKAAELIAEATEQLNQAKDQIRREKSEVNQAGKETLAKAEQRLADAHAAASQIIDGAKARAEEIAGDAYAAMNRAKEFQDTANALKNIIEGYGDRYIIPTYSLLDNLAEEFGYTEAGQKLKEARDLTRSMILTSRAADCDYAEANRKETAIRFVLDAFNGKIDSILSRTKADNHGKLAQEIKDAYSLVNNNGRAFRNARITEEYLSARLDELRWAATTQALKDKERDEQRALREQMREEEKARREYERALKEASKEEETLRKAMEKVQKQVMEANEAQRAEFESRLSGLQEQLKQAEEKNQRALSMAQQTKAGHVYVISNIGSFGEEVLKIGMTRRLEPKDRIRELGDASVPFEFDIHAMLFSDDAPGLEKALHRHFLRKQMNKVNPRKEFFRISLNEIREELERLGHNIHWTMKAEAAEYRASLQIEQQILENPSIEAEWTRHQLQVESENEEELEAGV